MAEEKWQEKREYVRVAMATQVRVQPVSRQEFENQETLALDSLPEAIPAGGETAADDHSAPLAQQLARIEEKLDRVLRKLFPEEAFDEPVAVGTVRNVSGAGVNLVLKEAFDLGQLVLISLSVPGFTIGNLQAYGEIVRVTPCKGDGQPGFETAIKFLAISEAEREKLISYAFTKQRQEIRGLSVKKEQDRGRIDINEK